MPPGELAPSGEAVAVTSLLGEGSLLDAVDRLLDVGAVAAGEATISVAGVDLIYLGLNVVLSSVETLRRAAGEPGPDVRGPGAAGPSLSAPTAGTARQAPSPTSPPPWERGRTSQGLPTASHTPPVSPQNWATGVGHPCSTPAGRPSSSPPGLGDRRGEGACRTDGPALPAPATPVAPDRIDIAPDSPEQGLAKLVLTLVEFVRQLLERQAVRRMEGGGLSEEEVERMGLALLRLREQLWLLAGQFRLRPEDLNVDLGPLGTLT